MNKEPESVHPSHVALYVFIAIVSLLGAWAMLGDMAREVMAPVMDGPRGQVRDERPEPSEPDEPNAPVACTMEARICPDGTAVGRSGPKCEFAPCPAN